MPINILYVEFHGELKGGGQISLLNLIKSLNRKRYKPYVICSYNGNYVKMLQEFDVEVFIVEINPLKTFNLIGVFKTLWGFIKIIKKYQIQIIHSNVSRGAIYGGLAAKFTGIPHICHVRIPYSDGWIDRLLSALSGRVIVVSKAVGRRFTWLKEPKLRVIYNGVDLKYFSQKSLDTHLKNQLGYSDRHKIIGAINRIHPEKGYHIILEAIPLVISKFPDARFLFAGDSGEDIKYRKELDTIIKKRQIQDYVRFIDFDPDVSRVIAIFDILLVPTLPEGFNRSIIEGMACEKPVIVSDQGGNPEAVIDCESGIVIPPENPYALAGAIIELLSDEEKMKRLALEGRKRVEKYFTNEIHALNIEKIYEECLA